MFVPLFWFVVLMVVTHVVRDVGLFVVVVNEFGATLVVWCDARGCIIVGGWFVLKMLVFDPLVVLAFDGSVVAIWVRYGWYVWRFVELVTVPPVGCFGRPWRLGSVIGNVSSM